MNLFGDLVLNTSKYAYVNTSTLSQQTQSFVFNIKKKGSYPLSF